MISKVERRADCFEVRGYIFKFLNLRIEIISDVCLENSNVTEQYYTFKLLIFKIWYIGIRTALLESDDHTCPTCHQNDVSPDALIANKFLRQVAILLFLL